MAVDFRSRSAVFNPHWLPDLHSRLIALKRRRYAAGQERCAIDLSKDFN